MFTMQKKFIVKLIVLIFLFMMLNNIVLSQNKEPSDSIKNEVSNWSFGGYVDTYYALYTDSIDAGEPQQFPGISPTSNSISINTALISGEYKSENTRAKLSFIYGNIPLYSLPNKFNNIYEAYVGTKLCKNLWVDVGFLQSHLGAESNLPKDNIATSWAMLTYITAMNQAEICFDYTPSEKLEINFHILNGYGIYEDNNKKKSVGLGVYYQLNEYLELCYSNYCGDDAPAGDSLDRTKLYNDLVLNYAKGKYKVQASLAHIIQRNSDLVTLGKSAQMIGGLITGRYQLINKLGIYNRWDFFNDPQGFMVGTFVNSQNNLTGINQWGTTAGLEIQVSEHSYFRLEGKRMQLGNNQKIFKYNNEYTNIRWDLMLNFGITF